METSPRVAEDEEVTLPVCPDGKQCPMFHSHVHHFANKNCVYHPKCLLVLPWEKRTECRNHYAGYTHNAHVENSAGKEQRVEGKEQRMEGRILGRVPKNPIVITAATGRYSRESRGIPIQDRATDVVAHGKEEKITFATSWPFNNEPSIPTEKNVKSEPSVPSTNTPQSWKGVVESIDATSASDEKKSSSPRRCKFIKEKRFFDERWWNGLWCGNIVDNPSHALCKSCFESADGKEFAKNLEKKNGKKMEKKTGRKNSPAVTLTVLKPEETNDNDI